jgi:hypothetical protein
LFIFCQHKQLPMVAQFFKSYVSQEVTRPREVATDPTFLTGLNFFLRPFLSKLCLLKVTIFNPKIEEKLNIEFSVLVSF